MGTEFPSLTSASEEVVGRITNEDLLEVTVETEQTDTIESVIPQNDYVVSPQRTGTQSRITDVTAEHNYCFSKVDERITPNTEPCPIKDTLVEVNGEVTVRPDDGLEVDFVSSMVEVIENVEMTSETAVKLSSGSEDDSSDTDSETSTSSDETSSDDKDLCSEQIRQQDVELEELRTLKNVEPPRVKGEVASCDLPPVEDISASLPESAILEVIGKVSHIMPDHSIIVQSYSAKPALDSETILFFSRDLAIGKVQETFGPVPFPYYVVRFNSEEQLISKGVELGREVLYAPHIQDYTNFVFVSALKQIRGSDASWYNDVEPPPACLDFSDDEQEREARKRRKHQKSDAQSSNKMNYQVQQMQSRVDDNKPHMNFHASRPDQVQLAWQTAITRRPNRMAGEFVRPQLRFIRPPQLPEFTHFQRPQTDFEHRTFGPTSEYYF